MKPATGRWRYPDYLAIKAPAPAAAMAINLLILMSFQPLSKTRQGQVCHISLDAGAGHSVHACPFD